MDKHQILKFSVNSILILLVGGVVGTALLVISYCFPISRIKDSLASGSFHIIEETSQFGYAPGFPSAIV